LALFFIIAGGIVMTAFGLVGGVTVWLREDVQKRVLLPLVAFAAGAMFGGALFHMIPASITELGNTTTTYVLIGVGFATFFCLEQFLHWHHCHRPTSEHAHPLTYLLLIADTVHNFVEGIAVGATFIVAIPLGITTWLVAAAHELPQEMGDFGVLVHGGWSVKKALVYNTLSNLSFLLGGIVAYVLSGTFHVAYAVPFAAGSFLYIAAVDLVPEINKHHRVRTNLLHFACFMGGLALLLAIRHLEPDVDRPAPAARSLVAPN
jgi:zinc and cadmium transporter